MIATLLLLLGLLDGGPAHAAPVYAVPVARTGQPQVALARTALPAWPSIRATEGITSHFYLPFIIVQEPAGCAPIPGVVYGTLDADHGANGRLAEEHPDKNLALRGYEPTSAYPGLVDITGPADSRAPQLYTLFGDQRVPAFSSLYQVYDWDWEHEQRGDLLDVWDVTLAGMGAAPGEIIHLPDSGYNIGNGHDALVLYAAEERITFKYTIEDDVVAGYTIHVENICVEPSLLALYQEMNDAGRERLPALRGGQPFGRAVGGEIGVAIRDRGDFLDTRSRKDWWQGR